MVVLLLLLFVSLRGRGGVFLEILWNIFNCADMEEKEQDEQEQEVRQTDRKSQRKSDSSLT